MNRFPTIQEIKDSPVASRNKHLFDEKIAMPQKRSKFGNRKVEIDGEVFDSLKESRRYVALRMQQAAGEIYGLECHPIFILSVCEYLADFQYYKKDGEFVVEDVKSKITRRLSTYRLKKKLMKAELNIDIMEV